MPDDFDPYYAWLGIPPKEQPCNYYRLLGLTIFEADLDVIDAAAARQIAHVRNYQLKHPEDATRILQELVEAKSCLMTAKRKASYDRTLVVPVAVKQVPPPPPASTPPASVPPASVQAESTQVESAAATSDAVSTQPALQIDIQSNHAAYSSKLNRSGKKATSKTWFPKALAGISVAGLAAMLLWSLAGDEPFALFASREVPGPNQDNSTTGTFSGDRTSDAQPLFPERPGDGTSSDQATTENNQILPTAMDSDPEQPSSEGSASSSDTVGEKDSDRINLNQNPTRFAPNGDPPPLAIAPFSPDEAKAHQQAWANYLNVPVKYTNELGMTFMLIPPGEFLMGCTPAQSKLILEYAKQQMKGHVFDNYQKNVAAISPQRKVSISRPFYLSVRETTTEQFQKITNNTVTADESPVRDINWNQASEFCQRLSKLGEREHAYRLPTSAEWEMACRAGSTGLRYFAESDDTPNNGNVALDTFLSNDGPQAINPWGLRGMYGSRDKNASLGEWTVDWLEFPDSTAGLDPVGPETGEARVTRGCGWNNTPVQSTSVERGGAAPSTTSTNIGFRVLLQISGQFPVAKNDRNTPDANAPSELNSQRAPIPTKASLESAFVKFNQTFADRKADIDKLRWPEQSTAFRDLAREIHELHQAESDLALKYLILEQSVQWAIESADADLTEQHIAAFEQNFQIDGLAYRADAASRWMEVSKSQFRGSQLIAARNRIVEWIIPLAKRFEQEERYDEAISLLDLAISLVGGSRERQRMLRVLSRQIKTKSERRASMLTLEESVKQAPNAAKFSKLGNYWCFEIGDWKKGLEFLAQSDDPVYSAAAKLDLETEVMGPLQLPIAEAWYQVALNLKDEQQRRVAVRARKLIEGSQNSLQGLELKQAESLLEKLVEMTVGGATPAIAPFPANVAQDRQRAWAGRLNLPVELTNSIGMTFVLIPPGEFTMGYNEPQTRFYPAHRVTITRPYYLGKTELTVDQYNSLTNKQLVRGVDSRPHIQNWNAATEFCKDLTNYEKGRLYRLPTEAEWEFAHRAGRMDLPEPQQVQLALAAGWYKSNSGDTLHPVAKKPANAWGLHDMFGNAGEWVQDFPYVFPMIPKRVDPQSPPDANTARNSFTARGLPSPEGTRRITRGGSFNREVLDGGTVKWYRYTTRHSGYQSSDYGSTGARLLLEIDVAAQPAQPQ